MKRVIFISFLFVVLQSSSAFCSLSVYDYKQMEVEGKEPNWNEITQDQTSYENWLDYLTEKTNAHYTMPSFSQVADLTANLLAYSVGNYADVASGVLSDLENTFSLGSDIWDFMTFTVQQMAFDYAPDFVELLKSGVDEEIYTSHSSGPVVGGWYECPYATDTYFQSNYLRYLDFVDYNGSAPMYVCFYTGSQSGNHYVVFASFVSGQESRVNQYFSSNNGETWEYSYAGYSLNSTYHGTESLGYFCTVNLNFFNAPYNLFPFYSDYGNQNDALADLFGWDGTIEGGESTLNGKGIIVNDNPVINPVTLTSALGYPFKQTVINNYNNNTPIPWRPNNYNYVDYNYNYEVPFWEGQELETLEYPAEIEFPSVEFETIEVDQSVDNALENLNGSWIVEFFLVAILLLILGLIL